MGPKYNMGPKMSVSIIDEPKQVCVYKLIVSIWENICKMNYKRWKFQKNWIIEPIARMEFVLFLQGNFDMKLKSCP